MLVQQKSHHPGWDSGILCAYIGGGARQSRALLAGFVCIRIREWMRIKLRLGCKDIDGTGLPFLKELCRLIYLKMLSMG